MTSDDLGKMLVKLAEINWKLSDENFLKELNTDILSYTAVKVAAMKATLIEFKVTAHQNMLDMEVEKDRQKAIAFAKYKATDGSTAAGDMKYMDEDFILAEQNFNKAKVSYEQLKSITADSHDLIDSIKSRIIDIQSARKDER